MYLPDDFTSKHPTLPLDHLHQYPLATLCFTDGQSLVVDHLPLLTTVDTNGQLISLQGHFAKRNPLNSFLLSPLACIAIFMGPSGYVSPAWYRDTMTKPSTVPTYDYVVVHVEGIATRIENRDWKADNVRALVTTMELQAGTDWAIRDVHDPRFSGMLEYIVGIEIAVNSITMKSKLHQNHSRGNIEGIIEGLRAQDQEGGVTLADLIARVHTPTQHGDP